MILWGWVFLFWCMQIIAYSAFKYGSLHANHDRGRWYAGFIGGNLVGVASVYPLMRVYECLAANPNLGAVLTSVGTAIGCQVAMAFLFRSRLAWTQWAGIALATLGTILATI